MIRKATLLLAVLFLAVPGRPVHSEETRNAMLNQTFYPDGKVMTEDKIEDGRMVNRRYYPGGKVQSETVRLSDTDYETRTYFESGRLEGESKESSSGQSLREYDEKGTLRKEVVMDEHGKTERAFGEDGSLQSEDANGVRREFFADGKLRFEETVKDGRGTRTVYDESGAKKQEIRIENGQASHFKVYDADGKLEFDGPVQEYAAKYYPEPASAPAQPETPADSASGPAGKSGPGGNGPAR